MTTNITNDSFKDIEKELIKAIVDAAKSTAVFGEGILKNQAGAERIFDTGNFIRSIISDVKVDPTSVTITIGSTAPYAETIEFGRDPGKFPPLDALVGWTGRKFGYGNTTASYDSLKAKAAAGDKNAREHMQAVFLVGRKIARKGIEAKKFFSKNASKIDTLWLAELEKELL